jgi:hypothetical protein
VSSASKSTRESFIELIVRHLGRRPRRADGATVATVQRCERRLGLTLPVAMREYYLLANRLDQLNKAYNQLLSLGELRVESGHLVFMEENQEVVDWGVPVRRLGEIDPIVFQRANAPRARWYSERLRFSAFLIRMFDWQAGMR